MTSAQTNCRNKLIRTLSAEDFDALRPLLDRTRFEPGQMLDVAGGRVDHVYLPEGGLLALASRSANGHILNTGMIGLEGLTGHSLLMGHTHSSRNIVAQIAGDAFRVEAKPFALMLRQRTEMHCTMLAFVDAMFGQLAETALANGVGRIDTRLARWLLMAADRLETSELRITHEFLADALGVRRPGITEALHRLEGMYLIKSHRLRVIIHDRAGLEAFTGGLYIQDPYLPSAPTPTGLPAAVQRRHIEPRSSRG